MKGLKCVSRYFPITQEGERSVQAERTACINSRQEEMIHLEKQKLDFREITK